MTGLTGSVYSNDIIVNWALTALAIVLTIGRYFIRYFYSQKLYWDDLAHLFALLTLIAHGATNQLTLEYKAEVKNALASPNTTPGQMLAMEQHQSYLNTVNNCLLYLVFWEVKVSFLLFYRHLFHSNKRFNIAWWIILVVTVCLVWAPIGGVLATCAGATTLADYKICSSATQARTTKLIYTCVINVVTDLAIMALPFWMLQQLKIRSPQKLALGFVFSLAIVTVVLDIVRTVEAIDGNQDLYTILELNFNVILSCLPSYKALLKLDQRKSSKYYRYGNSGRASGGTSRRGILSRLRSGSFSANKSLGMSSHGDNDGAEMNKIRVEHRITIERQGARDPYHIPDSSGQSLVDVEELQNQHHALPEEYEHSQHSDHVPIQTHPISAAELAV